MKRIGFLLLTLCLFLSWWGMTDAQAQTYEDRYCFTEIRPGFSGSQEVTYCASSPMKCIDEIGLHRNRPGNESYEYTGDCSDPQTALNICTQANSPLSCFDYTYTRIVPGQSSDRRTISACTNTSDSCVDLIPDERDFFDSIDWPFSSGACGQSRSQQVCAIDDATVDIDLGGADFGSYHCYERVDFIDGQLEPASKSYQRCFPTAEICRTAKGRDIALVDAAGRRNQVENGNDCSQRYNPSIMCQDNYQCYQADGVYIGRSYIAGGSPMLTCFDSNMATKCESVRGLHSSQGVSGRCVPIAGESICQNVTTPQTEQFCLEAEHDSGKGAIICAKARAECLNAKQACDDLGVCSVSLDSPFCIGVLRDQPDVNIPTTTYLAALERLIPGLAVELTPTVVSGLTYVSSNSRAAGGVTDSDGDGIEDNDDSCPNRANRGVDEDGDGIDVVCDRDDTDSDIGSSALAKKPIVDCSKELDTEYCLKDPLSLAICNPDDPAPGCNCYPGFDGETVCERSNTIFTLIYKIVVGLTNVLIPLSVVFIIWAGLRYVVASGNESKIKDANRTLTNVLIGVILIVGARIFVVVINGIITSL